jgi:hypothetical protein
MRFRTYGVLFSLVVAFVGCGNEDVGKACAVSECDVQNPPDNANTVCEPAVGCETLLCVGQGQGPGSGNVDQYCTIDCDIDGNDCPEGFVCELVAEVGGNPNRTTCLKPL